MSADAATEGASCRQVGATSGWKQGNRRTRTASTSRPAAQSTGGHTNDAGREGYSRPVRVLAAFTSCP